MELRRMMNINQAGQVGNQRILKGRVPPDFPLAWLLLLSTLKLSLIIVSLLLTLQSEHRKRMF